MLPPQLFFMPGTVDSVGNCKREYIAQERHCLRYERWAEVVHRHTTKVFIPLEDSVGAIFSTPELIVWLDPCRSTTVVAGVLETSGQAERLALVLLVGSPVHADRTQACEKVVAECGNERSVPASAVGLDQGEGVFRVIVVGRFVYGMSLAADHLAGHDEGFAWKCHGFIDFDAAVFIGFGGKDEGVDLVAELDGELEEWAVILGVDFF